MFTNAKVFSMSEGMVAKEVISLFLKVLFFVEACGKRK
jgi:hypothetical protein|tara:strand:+ start:8126 stop:8239 length:114 start_codon:yes stop_codon:yes gene_type:complete